MIELVNDDEIRYHRKCSREQLIGKLYEWIKKYGRIPQARDFVNNPNYPSFAIYQKEFGSWNNALIETGIGIRKKDKKYSIEQLINILQEWLKENGRIPQLRDFVNNPNYPSFAIYQKEFGSWNNALIEAGIEINEDLPTVRGRYGEIQTISEFKTKGAIDLSGQNRNSTCDGICPKGELFDTKSASLTQMQGHWGWKFSVTISQLEEAEYLFLRAYKDKDFTKRTIHKWRIPIDFMSNRLHIFIYKDKKSSKYNVDNMKKYEV